MCYVRDCGRAIARLQTTQAVDHRTYNVGTGRITTNREVAEAVMRAVPGATHGRKPDAPA